MGLGSVLEVLYAAVNNKHVNINSVSTLYARTCPFLDTSALTSVKMEALGTFTIYAISIIQKRLFSFTSKCQFLNILGVVFLSTTTNYN